MTEKLDAVDKWVEHKKARDVIVKLGVLVMRALRAGVARGVPGAATVLALLRHQTGSGRLTDSAALVRALRDDMRVVEGMSNGEDMAYLLAPLDAMIDTPGVQYVWGGVQFATAADYAGVVAALDAAVLRVEALHEALPIARNHLGRPRVCLLSMGSNRWHAATVGRITPKRVVLTTPDGDVTLKREKGYPAVAGAAFDVDDYELDRILRGAGQATP